MGVVADVRGCPGLSDPTVSGRSGASLRISSVGKQRGSMQHSACTTRRASAALHACIAARRANIIPCYRSRRGPTPTMSLALASRALTHCIWIWVSAAQHACAARPSHLRSAADVPWPPLFRPRGVMYSFALTADRSETTSTTESSIVWPLRPPRRRLRARRQRLSPGSRCSGGIRGGFAAGCSGCAGGFTFGNDDDGVGQLLVALGSAAWVPWQSEASHICVAQQ